MVGHQKKERNAPHLVKVVNFIYIAIKIYEIIKNA